MEIEVVRSYGYYLLSAYIPAINLVLMSWIPMWLNRRETTSRLGLAMVTTIAMGVLCVHTNALRPKISYISALDAYLGFSWIMVFLSLIESSFVSYRLYSMSNKALDIQTDEDLRKRCINWNNWRFYAKMLTNVDYLSRWMFPLIYLMFNLCYWRFMLNWVNWLE